MGQIKISVPGISSATSAATAAAQWVAMANAPAVAGATPAYRFGQLLAEVGGSWSNSSQGTVLAAAPPIMDRVPQAVYDAAIAAAPPAWIYYSDAEPLQVKSLRWTDSGGTIRGPVYLAGDTVVDATAANVVRVGMDGDEPNPSVFDTQNIYPVVATITAPVTLPAAGATATIQIGSITAPNGAAIATAQAYQQGDLVQLSQYLADGTTAREAYFTVASVAGSTITATVLSRAGQTLVAADGAVFATGSELTGQTRLTPPVGATQAAIYVNDAPAFRLALVDSTNPRNRVASIIAQRFPMLQLNPRGDVDPIQGPGIPLTAFGQLTLETVADIAAARLFCTTLGQFRPILHVVYR